ncbi:MAG TPA: ATP-binding protein [Stellaceae bacterium]|nr:ATP-binding protein [Stellaceae bacterium]
MIDPHDAAATPTRSGSRRRRLSLTRPVPDQRPRYRWVWGVAALCALGVISLNALILNQFRKAALNDAETSVVKLSAVYAEASNRTFQSVDLVVSTLAAALTPAARTGQMAFREAVASLASGKLMARGTTPQLVALAVVDATGNMLIWSGGTISRPVSLADRDYFIALRDHPNLQRYISAPEVNPTTGTRAIFLARRLTSPGGAFAGLVVATIRLNYLQDFYRASGAGADDSVALWRDDGTLLVRYPALPVSPQATPAELQTFRKLGAAPGPRLTRSSVGVKPMPVIIARHALHSFPLAVTVSLTQAAALAQWRREATVIGGAAAAGVVVILLIALLMRRHLLARAQVVAARAEIGIEATARAALEQAMARAEEAIREHERAERALRESEQRFRDVAEVGADVIWESGPDHRFTFFSCGSESEIRNRLNVDVAGVIGKTRWEIASADPDGSAVWRDHKRDLDAHLPFRDFRYSVPGEDGRVVYFTVSGKPVFGAEGCFAGYRGVGSNETAVIEARSRAERAESLLHDAVDSISEGFVIYDQDDRLALCNEAFLNLFPSNRAILIPGTRFEDIVREGLARRLYSDAIGREEEWLAERMEAHRNPPPQVEARHTDGRWLLICERRMRNGGTAGLRIDITALKTVQLQLQESEERLNRAQRLAKMGCDTRDLRTDHREWSDETYRIFGVTRETFNPTTENLLTRVHPDDRLTILKSREETAGGVRPEPVEFRILRPDGAVRYVAREAELVLDERGEPIMVAGTIRDITDLRASQARQKELERQLQHSQKMKALGTLAGGIAHDLNNTLVPILSLSKMVAERLPAGTDEREDLETITFASERARDLLQQILAFSRNQVSVKKSTNLAAVAHKTLKMLRVTVPEGVQLVEDIAQVPPIQGDAGQLQRVIGNLVTNSLHAIGKRAGSVTVTVARTAENDAEDEFAVPRDAVVLSVADTGCGMDAATAERIFEPFYTTKRVGEGTGLGLSVVHGIIADHGGRIEVDSKRRKGTVFRIILPVSAGRRTPTAPARGRHKQTVVTEAVVASL